MSDENKPNDDQTRELPTVDLDVPMVTLKGRKSSLPVEPPSAATSAAASPPHAPVQHAVPAAAPPTIPPGGSPPVAVPVPSPGESFLVRHRWHALGGAVGVVIACVVAILLLTSGGDDDTKLAGRLLSSSSADVKRVISAASQAAKTDGLVAVGTDAEQALAALSAVDAQVGEIESGPVRVAVSQQLAANRGVLSAFVALKGMERDADSLKSWQSQVRGQLAAAQGQLGAAVTAVQQLGVPDPAATIVTAAEVDAAALHIDGLVVNGVKSLDEFDDNLKKAKAKRRGRAQRAKSLQRYANSVVGAYDDYYQDRFRTQDFFRDVAPQIGPYGNRNIGEARDALRIYLADRNDTISRLGAVKVPSGMESAHQGLVGVVQQSLAGLEAFSSAIDEYFRTPPSYGLVDSPSWSTADSISDQVTVKYSIARSGWTQRLKSLVKKTRVPVKLPKLPDV